MFLQATVDCPDLQSATDLLSRYSGVEAIDYIEIGAPMITHYGSEVVNLFRQYFPTKRIYADLKMIDFPLMESAPYLELGIRRISAMAIMNDSAFAQLASLYDIYPDLTVWVSLMGYPIELVRQRVINLKRLRFNNFICHGAGITRREAFDDTNRYLGRMPNDIVRIAAGGIGLDNAQLLSAPVDGLIVGRGLVESDVPVKIAANLLKSSALVRNGCANA